MKTSSASCSCPVLKLLCRVGVGADLREAHDLARWGEHKDAAAQEIIGDAVHKLACGQAVHKFTLPLSDGVQPIDAPRHYLLVKLQPAISTRLEAQRSLNPPLHSGLQLLLWTFTVIRDEILQDNQLPGRAWSNNWTSCADLFDFDADLSAARLASRQAVVVTGRHTWARSLLMPLTLRVTPFPRSAFDSAVPFILFFVSRLPFSAGIPPE